jgi:cytosine/adenosine deaminase-related metal-dependent hydrolase
MSLTVVANASLLLGRSLSFVDKGFIEIEGGIIKSAGRGEYKARSDCRIIDAKGLLVLPGFINAHTHIADSIGKDIGIDSGLDARVHPVFGAKKKILNKSRPEHLKAFIRSSAISMMSKGIVAFADFREGGLQGLELLQDAISGLPVKCIKLGRIDIYFKPGTADRLSTESLRQARSVFEAGDGLGISGANENTDGSLEQYASLRRRLRLKLKLRGIQPRNSKKKLIAIHAAESADTMSRSKFSTGRTEVERIMDHLKPDFIVHMTNASDHDISLVAESGTGVVICPRANGALGAGLPRVAKMLKSGCLLAIGTDNVMLNSPDIFRELDYLWKACRAVEGVLVDPKELLKMATVNAAEILGLNSGCIEAGRAADLMFVDKNHIDLSPVHNPYASLVHRASQSSIRALMIDGRFAGEID